MIAVENIELYRYEIHSLLKAFYPQETVKVFVGEPDVRKYPDPAFLRAEFEEDYIRMTLNPAGAPGPESENAPEVERRVEAPAGISFKGKGPECKICSRSIPGQAFPGENLSG